MAWDDDLRGVHLEIARDPRSPLHVLAGPGTGKTFALMRRIARLLESGAPTDSILAVTFTRTAARDLKEQLARLGVEGAEEVRASTLHSLCYSILRNQVVFETTGRVPRPLLSYEETQLINDLSNQFGGKRRVKALLEAYEAGWARMQREQAGPPQNPIDQAFEAALLEWLVYHRSVLVGELIPLTLNYVRQNPAVDALPSFRQVIVDEYQDLNRADQALVVELARDGAMTVSGDDNQSIYSFRYANPQGIQTFPDEYAGTIPYVIEECRRCPPNIVRMSNNLIRNNPLRQRDIPLRETAGRPDATTYVVQHQSLDVEIDSIADFIHSYLEARPDLPPGQVLVLATRQFIGQGIKRALIARRHNALSYFFEDELETTSAAEGFCLLNLIVDPSDRAALRGWIGLGRENGLAPNYSRVKTWAQGNEIELREVLDQLLGAAIHIPYSASVTDRYRTLLNRVAQLDGLSGAELVAALWSAEDAQSSDIRRLADNIAVESAAPRELFEALSREITQPELPSSDSDIIRVMSLHKSKGLTASLVVIAGCVSGALPTIKASSVAAEDAQRAEQRRLFYVAITRASECLVISSSAAMRAREALSNGVAIRRYDRIDGNGERWVVTSASPYIRELGYAAPRTISTEQWRATAGFPAMNMDVVDAD